MIKVGKLIPNNILQKCRERTKKVFQTCKENSLILT